MRVIISAVINALNDVCPGWVIEHYFSLERRFCFDFALPSRRIAIEIEGGVWSYGCHTREMGYVWDMRKYNLAALEGWRVLRFTPEQTLNGKMIEDLKRLMMADSEGEGDYAISGISLREKTGK